MADTFQDGELFEIVRGVINTMAGEVNAHRASITALQNASGAVGIEWTATNTLDRVTRTIGGEPRTLVLRPGGNRTVDPASAQGAANWRIESDRVTRVTLAIGPYLAAGAIAYYDGKLYELLTAFTSLPGGASTNQWRLLTSAPSATGAPSVSPTSYGPTVFSGSTTNVEAGRTVTVSFSNAQPSATATTDANGAWSVTVGTRTGTFSLSVTNAGGDGAASGPHTVATGGSSEQPAAITTTRTVNVTSSTAALVWTRPDETNIDRYVLCRNGVEITTTAPRAESRASQPEQSYTFSNLAGSTTYELEVKPRGPTGLMGTGSSKTVTTLAATGGNTPQPPTKVKAATYPSQPTVADLYINGVLATPTEQFAYTIGGGSEILTREPYTRLNGLTAGQSTVISVRKKEGASYSAAVTTTIVPGDDSDGEANAGYPA